MKKWWRHTETFPKWLTDACSWFVHKARIGYFCFLGRTCADSSPRSSCALFALNKINGQFGVGLHVLVNYRRKDVPKIYLIMNRDVRKVSLTF